MFPSLFNRLDIKVIAIGFLTLLLATILITSGSNGKYEYKLAKEVYKEKIKELDKEFDMLEDSISLYQRRIEDYQKDRQERVEEIKKLNQKLAQKEKRIRELQKQREDLSETIENLTREERLKIWRKWY